MAGDFVRGLVLGVGEKADKNGKMQTYVDIGKEDSSEFNPATVLRVQEVRGSFKRGQDVFFEYDTRSGVSMKDNGKSRAWTFHTFVADRTSVIHQLNGEGVKAEAARK